MLDINEIKQILEQYFLLLNGKRAMTLGNDCEIKFNTAQDSLNRWFPEIQPSSPSGAYFFFRGGIYCYDETLDSVGIVLFTKDKLKYAWIALNHETANEFEIGTSDADTLISSAGKITLNPTTETIIKLVSEIKGKINGVFTPPIGSSLPSPSITYKGALYNKQGLIPPPTPAIDELYWCRKKAVFPPEYEWLKWFNPLEAGDIIGLAGKTLDFPIVDADDFKAGGVSGVSGTFQGLAGNIVTVINGIITDLGF